MRIAFFFFFCYFFCLMGKERREGTWRTNRQARRNKWISVVNWSSSGFVTVAQRGVVLRRKKSRSNISGREARRNPLNEISPSAERQTELVRPSATRQNCVRDIITYGERRVYKHIKVRTNRREFRVTSRVKTNDFPHSS